MLRLISDILDFSKIEAGKLTLESVEFSIHEQVTHGIEPALQVRSYPSHGTLSIETV